MQELANFVWSLVVGDPPAPPSRDVLTLPVGRYLHFEPRRERIKYYLCGVVTEQRGYSVTIKQCYFARREGESHGIYVRSTFHESRLNLKDYDVQLCPLGREAATGDPRNPHAALLERQPESVESTSSTSNEAVTDEARAVAHVGEAAPIPPPDTEPRPAAAPLDIDALPIGRTTTRTSW